VSILQAESSLTQVLGCPVTGRVFFAVEGQRAPALRFGDIRVQALFAVLVMFSRQLRGYTNQEIRPLLPQLPGLDPANYPIGE